MNGYVKLDRSILTSTVWGESWQTKLTWITMLALMDKYYEVHASIPGLAREAGVPVEDCRDAIVVLSSPDKDSRSKTYDGRRIEEIDGGWRVLNGPEYHKKYSIEWKREQDAERMRLARARAPKKNPRRRVTNEDMLADAAEELAAQDQDPRFPKCT